MAHYTLSVQHRGTEAGDFCVYQTHDGQSEDIRSLAWFSKRARPETDLQFEWNVDYGFTWSRQGVLTPDMVFEASQIVTADPGNLCCNGIAFTKRDNAFQFAQIGEPTAQGRLRISCDSSVPARAASVGISVSGKPAFACPASPNMKYTFRPHPRYWIAFGKFDEGEVIDLNRVTRKFEIRFRENQYDKKICLTEMNTWEDLSD